MKRQSNDNEISLREYIDLKFNNLENKFEEWRKEYVTQLQMRNALDELRQDIQKDLSSRRKDINERVEVLEKSVDRLAYLGKVITVVMGLIVTGAEILRIFRIL